MRFLILLPVAAFSLANASAQADTCYSLKGPITVTSEQIQLPGQAPVAVRRTVGPIDIYRSLDSSLVLSIPNPAFPGSSCRIQDSPLPHHQNQWICPGHLELDGSSEDMPCSNG